ncbi:FUSC family protein [Arthrobacter sp. H14-L1]|uniref:FUSC family protein n=1 Tax=Arthrobacter sp. H14-L1 TaxID=2996697 RepID=UPI00226E126B|nr:FUSC family protein [Arthrobacter sp. H14-L1]MCY0903469.1 FUSC family protein [Arthrobacter sp. H14-L1]
MAVVREFFRLGPARDDHYPALRCAIGVAVPLLVLLFLGRSDLAIYAVFGAFTGIFGRGESYRLRMAHQLQAGLLILTAVTLGSLNSLAGAAPWWIISTTAAVGAVGAVAAERLRLGPVGPFFFIFPFAATSYIPLTVPLSVPLLTTALPVVLAVVVGISGWFIRRALGKPSRPRPATASRSVNSPAVRLQAMRYALAIAAAGALATITGVGHSYWAMVSAAVPLMGPDMAKRVIRGVHRILGTLAGLGVLWLVLLLALTPWQVVLLVVVLQFLAEVFVARHYGLALLFITPLALLMTELAHPGNVGLLMLERAVETGIGAAVGIAVALLLRDRNRPRGMPRTARRLP